MSKTGNWVLELEEEFYDKCCHIVSDCEHMEEFVSKMSAHYDLVKHFSDDDITEIVNSVWNDYWEENRP